LQAAPEIHKNIQRGVPSNITYGELPTQLAQRSHLVAAERVRARFPPLGATHVQRRTAAKL
jgi:hypothetical protein